MKTGVVIGTALGATFLAWLLLPKEAGAAVPPKGDGTKPEECPAGIKRATVGGNGAVVCPEGTTLIDPSVAPGQCGCAPTRAPVSLTVPGPGEPFSLLLLRGFGAIPPGRITDERVVAHPEIYQVFGPFSGLTSPVAQLAFLQGSGLVLSDKNNPVNSAAWVAVYDANGNIGTDFRQSANGGNYFVYTAEDGLIMTPG